MLNISRRFFHAALVGGLLAATPIVSGSVVGPVMAHEFKAGALVLKHPWTRATAKGAQMGGGFLTIVNTGSEADTLTGGSLDLAGNTEVHEMRMDGDVMKMRQLEGGLEIPAGATVELKPGSYHLMFMKLSRPLEAGTKIKGTLVFEKAGEVPVEFAVEAIDATGKDGKMSGHDSMPAGGVGMKHDGQGN